MIDAPFSSPDGEPSMEKGDEENALPKSNRNQLPSLSTPNDQTNSEGEETALKALCELDDNNVNRKTNEGAKQCDDIPQKNGKRPRDLCDSDSLLSPDKMRGVRDILKKVHGHIDDEDVCCDISEKIETCDQMIDALEKKNREARKSTPDSNKDVPPTETKTVGDWELVGTFDKTEDAQSKAFEYFARKKSRCLGGSTLVGKRFFYTYRCAEHLEDTVKCPTRARIRWNKSTNFKYVVDVTYSEECTATYLKNGNKEVRLIEAGNVKDQNGEAAEGVHQRMYAKDGRKRGLNGDAKRIISTELQSNGGNVNATNIMSTLEQEGFGNAVSIKQLQVRSFLSL